MLDAINKGSIGAHQRGFHAVKKMCCLNKDIFLLDTTLAVEDTHRYPKNKITVKNLFDNIMTCVSWLVLEEIALT